jgi:hypothetical protein
MKFCRRILAGLTLLVSTVMLLACIAVGIGVWIVKEPVTAKATKVFNRIEAALDIADHGLDHARTSLERAAERLDEVKQKQRKAAAEAAKNRPRFDLRGSLARMVQQRIAPEVSNAHEDLHTVAEAAFVVNSVLEDLGNFPLLSATGLDVDHLTEMNNNLARVAPAAWELSRLLDTRSSNTESDEGVQLSRVEQSVKSMLGVIGEYEVQARDVRERTEDLKSRTLPWITPAAIIISAVCFWLALSQISLLSHAWSWLRR